MDKLTRYNQKILAALGTLALLSLVVILIISLGVWIVSMIGNRPRVDNTLKVTDSLQHQDNKITQLASYQEPELIDTANNIYIIPVSQRTLSKPIEERNLDLGLSKVGSYSSNEYYYGREGSFNNIVIYRKNDELKKPLFDVRINITRYFILEIKDQIYLFVQGSKGDTNNDGTYSYQDLENLYIYDLQKDQLHTADLKNATYTGIQDLYDTDQMVISFGMDINEDGEFDGSREPTRLKHYSVFNNQLSDFISEEIDRKIQNLID